MGTNTIKILALEDLFSPKGLRVARKDQVVQMLRSDAQAHVDAGRAVVQADGRKAVNLADMIKAEAARRAAAMEGKVTKGKKGAANKAK